MLVVDLTEYKHESPYAPGFGFLMEQKSISNNLKLTDRLLLR